MNRRIQATNINSLTDARQTVSRPLRGKLHDSFRLLWRDLLAHDLASRNLAELEGDECAGANLYVVVNPTKIIII